MLGFALIYFIWKKFSELAFEYDKNKWLYFIVAIITYYGCTFFAGILIGLLDVFANTNFIETTPEWALGILALPIGILGTWLLYRFLKKKWIREKELISDSSEVLDTEV